MIMELRRHGFTLIELMIVVAIIGIFASIAIPKFASLLSKSQEATTKGNLGTLRTALSIYYADTNGALPTNPAFLSGKYLKNMPLAVFPKTPNNAGHPSSHTTTLVATTGGLGLISFYETIFTDDGGWMYDAGAIDPNWGNIIADCSQADIRGKSWYLY